MKQAYRELLKVWHPDRFPDAKFQKRATEKTKALNEGYQKITAYLSGYLHRIPRQRQSQSGN